MRPKTLFLVCTLMFFQIAALGGARQEGADALSGTWAGDWGPNANDRNPVTVELKWDGTALTGTVNPGQNAVALQNATFDPKTGAVHMEAHAKGRSGDAMHYVIDGKLENGTISGSWSHEKRKGDFKITKK